MAANTIRARMIERSLVICARHSNGKISLEAIKALKKFDSNIFCHKWIMQKELDAS